MLDIVRLWMGQPAWQARPAPLSPELLSLWHLARACCQPLLVAAWLLDTQGSAQSLTSYIATAMNTGSVQGKFQRRKEGFVSEFMLIAWLPPRLWLPQLYLSLGRAVLPLAKKGQVLWLSLRCLKPLLWQMACREELVFSHLKFLSWHHWMG